MITIQKYAELTNLTVKQTRDLIRKGELFTHKVKNIVQILSDPYIHERLEDDELFEAEFLINNFPVSCLIDDITPIGYKWNGEKRFNYKKNDTGEFLASDVDVYLQSHPEKKEDLCTESIKALFKLIGLVNYLRVFNNRTPKNDLRINAISNGINVLTNWLQSEKEKLHDYYK